MPGSANRPCGGFKLAVWSLTRLLKAAPGTRSTDRRDV